MIGAMLASFATAEIISKNKETSPQESDGEAQIIYVHVDVPGP